VGGGSEPDKADLGDVGRIRLGSTTHAFDMNQRFQRLAFTRGAGALNVSAPGSRNRTPPGHYMLFILNGNGVPSVAKIIRIGTTSAPNPPVNAPPTAAFTSSCSNLSCNFTDGSSDADGTVAAWSWTFGDGTASTAPNPSHSYGAAGSYTVALKVTDNLGATNQRTAGVTVIAPPPPPPPPPSGIVLQVTPRIDSTWFRMRLTWTGAKGATLDLYRDGSYLKHEANDGMYTNSQIIRGPRTYTFRICELGTQTCSNNAVAVLK